MKRLINAIETLTATLRWNTQVQERKNEIETEKIELWKKELELSQKNIEFQSAYLGLSRDAMDTVGRMVDELSSEYGDDPYED